ncbi:MAG TPA: YceI family protein [Thermodesulfovibrionales bacterium]|jgi:polyisoprenoid-binding protein YceI|nr:YceI family protein [Thermodesulfovibrionales bacterium]
MSKWIVDPDHSVAAFVVRHMMVANVRGQFNKISGTINFDPDDVAKSSVEVVIDASGIYTGIPKRDDHLRSPDFLDVEKFPHILFKSAYVAGAGENRLRITGQLTIHGITKQVTLEADCTGPEKSPYGETSRGFTASVSINREDYNIMWNEPLGSGGVMVGKEILITLEIEADLQDK